MVGGLQCIIHTSSITEHIWIETELQSTRTSVQQTDMKKTSSGKKNHIYKWTYVQLPQWTGCKHATNILSLAFSLTEEKEMGLLIKVLYLVFSLFTGQKDINLAQLAMENRAQLSTPKSKLDNTEKYAVVILLLYRQSEV